VVLGVVEARNLQRSAPGRDDGVVEGDGLGVGREVVWLDLDRLVVDERPRPLDERHAVRPAERLDAAGEPRDDGVLPRSEVVEREFAGSLDAQLGDLVVAARVARRLDERLRRDAAVVQADAARLAALDQHRLEATLRGPDRRHVAAGSRTDYDEVRRRRSSLSTHCMALRSPALKS